MSKNIQVIVSEDVVQSEKKIKAIPNSKLLSLKIKNPFTALSCIQRKSPHLYLYNPLFKSQTNSQFLRFLVDNEPFYVPLVQTNVEFSFISKTEIGDKVKYEFQCPNDPFGFYHFFLCLYHILYLFLQIQRN